MSNILGSSAFTTDIYPVAKAYPHDRTERFDMILQAYPKTAGAKIDDYSRGV